MTITQFFAENTSIIFFSIWQASFVTMETSCLHNALRPCPLPEQNNSCFFFLIACLLKCNFNCHGIMKWFIEWVQEKEKENASGKTVQTRSVIFPSLKELGDTVQSTKISLYLAINHFIHPRNLLNQRCHNYHWENPLSSFLTRFNAWLLMCVKFLRLWKPSSAVEVWYNKPCSLCLKSTSLKPVLYFRLLL